MSCCQEINEATKYIGSKVYESGKVWLLVAALTADVSGLIFVAFEFGTERQRLV